MNLSYAWSDAVSPERRDLVFENRNKEYGGYKIRRDYQRHLIFALLITLFGTGVAVTTPLILSHLSGTNAVAPKKFNGIVDFFDPPPVLKIVPPPPIFTTPPHVKTIKFTPPVVVQDNLVDEPPPPTQIDTKDAIAGISTQAGDILSDIPVDPVVSDVPDIPLTIVEEMPTFKGGDEKLFSFLSQIQYPGPARENNISGRVFVKFIVDKNGKVKEVTLLRGIGGGCDEEAMRVVKSMPDWNPGRQNGQNVSVYFILPVNFGLRH